MFQKSSSKEGFRVHLIRTLRFFSYEKVIVKKVRVPINEIFGPPRPERVLLRRNTLYTIGKALPSPLFQEREDPASRRQA